MNLLQTTYTSHKKIFDEGTSKTKTNDEQRNVSIKKNTYTSECVSVSFSLWAQLGLNQCPPDYES